MWCGWPSSVPAAAGWEVYTLLPYDFAPAQSWGQDNPLTVVTYPQTTGWFSTALKFPQPSAGGSWAQCAHLSSPYTDPAVDPYFSIAWASEAGPGQANFHIHVTAHPSGTAMAGGGPGTQVTQTTAALNDLMATNEMQVPITGVGASWGPDRIVNINLYRGSLPADSIPGPVNVFAVRVRYKLI